jgi:hypothetical protein
LRARAMRSQKPVVVIGGYWRRAGRR